MAATLPRAGALSTTQTRAQASASDAVSTSLPTAVAVQWFERQRQQRLIGTRALRCGWALR
jgi:hypothetical protein